MGLLAVYIAIMAFGIGLEAPLGVDAKLYAKSNLVNLLIWGIWWPLMIWVAVWLGRLWCMLCPLELVANVAERIGSRLGIRQRNLGKALRAGWLMLAMYLVVQMLVAGVQLHRAPNYTALFMLALLVVPAVVGLMWKNRAFCRGFCPVGLLLATYGRGGMLGVRAAAQDGCSRCAQKPCVAPSNRNRMDERSCPNLLNPPKLHTNKDCLLCGQCLKSCDCDTMQLVLRMPFSRHDTQETMASWPTTLFVIAASGFVMSELAAGWAQTEALFLWVPEQVVALLGVPGARGWIVGGWYLCVFPVIVWSLLGGVHVGLRGASALSHSWRRLALPTAVVVSFAHMAKSLEKISNWGGFLPSALANPDGLAASAAISAHAAHAPAALLPPVLYAGIGVALVALGLAFGIRQGGRADTLAWGMGWVPLWIIASVYAGCALGWAFG